MSRLSVVVISPSSAAAPFGMVASFFSVVSLSVFAEEVQSERENVGEKSDFVAELRLTVCEPLRRSISVGRA